MNSSQYLSPHKQAVLPSMEELYEVFYGDFDMHMTPALAPIQAPHQCGYEQRTPMAPNYNMTPRISTPRMPHRSPFSVHDYNTPFPAPNSRTSSCSNVSTSNTPLLFTNIPKLSKQISMSELKPIPQRHQVQCQWKKSCAQAIQLGPNSIKTHLYHSHQPDVWGATDPNYTIVCFWEWCGTPITGAGGGLDRLVKHVRETHLHVDDVECPFCGMSLKKWAFNSHAQRYHPEVQVRA